MTGDKSLLRLRDFQVDDRLCFAPDLLWTGCAVLEGFGVLASWTHQPAILIESCDCAVISNVGDLRVMTADRLQLIVHGGANIFDFAESRERCPDFVLPAMRRRDGRIGKCLAHDVRGCLVVGMPLGEVRNIEHPGCFCAQNRFDRRYAVREVFMNGAVGVSQEFHLCNPEHACGSFGFAFADPPCFFAAYTLQPEFS